MDRKNGGINLLIRRLRMMVFIVWGVLSTVTYGVVCIMISFISKDLARRIGRIWNIHLLEVGGVRVEVEGAEKLEKDQRYIFIVNHQSALDIPILFVGLHHKLSFIAKKELFYIPFFGWSIAAVGHIWIDRSNARKARASITRAVEKLQREGVSLVLFPEGTRSVDGKVGEFKKGSFTLAIQAGVKIVPIAIRDAHTLLPKKTLLIHPGVARISIGDPIDSTEYTMAQKGLLAQKLQEVIKEKVEAREKAAAG